MARYRDLQERILFLTAYVPETGCWLWLGKKDGCGYGRINVRAHGVVRAAPAHRIAYEAFRGGTPKKHDIHHVNGCDRACVAPGHLRPMPYRKHRALTGFCRANSPK